MMNHLRGMASEISEGHAGRKRGFLDQERKETHMPVLYSIVMTPP